jgi:CO dehydrogenase maturation factor
MSRGIRVIAAWWASLVFEAYSAAPGSRPSDHLAAGGYPVVAFDAEINQHLAQALGHDGAPPAVAQGVPARHQPAHRLARSDDQDNPARSGLAPGDLRRRRPRAGPLHAGPRRLRVLVSGALTEDDIGVACYHAETGAVELLLNHLLEGAGEYVVIDMTAGADASV